MPPTATSTAPPDVCEPDCNTNGLADECDISAGSDDCNTNGIPDECEADCNANGVADECDIDGGDSSDCNSDGIPDECQLSESAVLLDADFETGIPTGWTATGLWHATAACVIEGACDPTSWAYFGQDGACDFDTGSAVAGVLTAPAMDIPAGVPSALLTYCSVYDGEYGAAPNGLDAAWVTVNGQVVDDVGDSAPLGEWETRTVDLTAYAGQSVTLAWHFNSRDDRTNDKLGWQIDAIELVAGDLVDNDCNGNGRLDVCDLADGFSNDCNSNSIPDECDLAGGTSNDCNSNGIPDDCESTADCDSNGTPDICDLQVIYVDRDALGLDDGTSWINAFTDLQDALVFADAICIPTEIWVARGTYAPAGSGGSRTATFTLSANTTLYGGFSGSETLASQRDTDPATNATILTGDLNGNDAGASNRTENSYHVVTASGAPASAVLDGFTITAGNADGVSPNDRGAAIFIETGAAVIRNCHITNHTAQGGAVYIRSASPTFDLCTFHDNSAAFGGAVFTYVSSTPVFNRCLFRKNNATNSGGAVYSSSSAAPVFANTAFTGNSATNYGGAVYASGADPELINCTVTQNTAAGNGGGIGAIFASVPTIGNSILWNNTDAGGADETAQLYLDATSAAVTGHTCLAGLDEPLGAGNINTDPRFVDPDGADDIPGTADDDLRLASDSPCIDAAANADAVILDDKLDLAGFPRFVDDLATPDNRPGRPARHRHGRLRVSNRLQQQRHRRSRRHRRRYRPGLQRQRCPRCMRTGRQRLQLQRHSRHLRRCGRHQQRLLRRQRPRRM